MKNCNLENIELRSEKIRSIIGNIPASLLRYEVVIVLIILLFLFILLFFIPYNESYSVKLELSNENQKLNQVTDSKGLNHIDYTDNISNKLKFKAYVEKDIAKKIVIGQKVDVNASNFWCKINFEAIVSRTYPLSEGDLFKIEIESNNFMIFHEHFFYNSDFEGTVILSSQSLYRYFLLSRKLKKH